MLGLFGFVFTVIIVSNHEGAGVNGAEVFNGDGDDKEQAGAREGEAERGAVQNDEDVIGDEGEHGDETEAERAEKVEPADDFFEVVGGLEAGADALDEATLFLEVVGDFFGVEVDAGVEVGEHDDEDEEGGGVNEPLPVDTERIEIGKVAGAGCGEEGNELLGENRVGIATQDNLTDEGGEGEEGSGEDDGDDAGGDEL